MGTTSMIRTLAIVSVAFAGAGCAVERDYDLRLGGEVALEAVSPEWMLLPEGLSNQPSTTTLARDDWDEIVYLVPIDSVDRGQGPALRARYAQTPIRLTGEHPDAHSAIELDTEYPRRLISEAIAAPFWAALDFLSLPVRAAGYRAEDDQGRPLDWRRRTPHETSHGLEDS
ncbi:MAG: hypothetical protein EA376_01620 [Phycisphaeraceae bacterium]|nr:MAG: hypothetical protein EA376_01620 [Phycisphaeraceae bacterium]